MLEVEVGNLERYLLSLYRKAFDQQISSVSPAAKEHHICFVSPAARVERTPSSISATSRVKKTPSLTPRRLFVDEDAAEIATQVETSVLPDTSKRLYDTKKETIEDKNLDSSVLRCHSTLSHRTTLTTRPSPDSVAKALRACHSQPLSMSEVLTYVFLYPSVYVVIGMQYFGKRIYKLKLNSRMKDISSVNVLLDMIRSTKLKF